MAKDRKEKYEKYEKEEKSEMSLAEAKAYRQSLHKEKAQELGEHEKREQFRLYWAQNKYKYGKAKDLEEILWVHLKAAKLDHPEKFEDGIAHFGLKKIR